VGYIQRLGTRRLTEGTRYNRVTMDTQTAHITVDNQTKISRPILVISLLLPKYLKLNLKGYLWATNLYRIGFTPL